MTAGSLEGVVGIVTGGARGIGRATAEFLASGGASVAICARTRTELDETVDSIEANGAAAPVAAKVDVSDWEAAAAFVGTVVAALGPPTLLVNNAASLGPVGPLADADGDEWCRTLAVNVGGVAAMCAAVAPVMSGGGAVVNLSGGGVGGPGMAEAVSAYVASKAAVVALTEALAGEWAPAGITVNAIAPGAVATRFTEPILDAGPERAGALFHTTVAQRLASTPLEPFFDLVAYLASARGRWISGRLLSARWDSVAALEERRDAIAGGSLFTLRRIDDALYREVER
ncbi:MAG TPA: SDR family oxidoreductase [Acidimicrobiales bacterium]|nr:SDR family oxidoreductase [Acidimicrobiales bacterium]